MTVSRLCVMCAAKQRKTLDIRDQVWCYEQCPGCHTRQVIWPVLPAKLEPDKPAERQNERSQNQGGQKPT
jgi:hypothetical protein